MMRFSRSLAFAVPFVAALAVGCASKSSTDSSGAADPDGSDSTEASASAAQEGRIQEMLFSNVSSTDPELAAGSAAQQWWPAGCATRQRDATNKAVVHVTLNDCTGPFGLRQHSGDITITFSKGASGGLHAEATSSNMTVNGKPVTYAASADISFDANAKTITVNGNGAWTRVNAKGDTVSHTRQGTTVVDLVKKCRDWNGSAVTKVASREVDSTAKDYTVCRKADGTEGCPTGEITHTHKASGRTVIVDFDGSDEAKITGPKGNSVEVQLVCTP